jgi:glycosyltransferase involved in cell wall biosynthesis
MTASSLRDEPFFSIVVHIYLSHVQANMSDRKPSLLVAKGNMKRMGGAERDLLRCLPHLQQLFDVSVATLNPSTEMLELCREKKIRTFVPPTPWNPPTTALSQILNRVHTSSRQSWRRCEGLLESIENFDCFHIVSGDGYLAFMELIPQDKTAHLHLLEPHRGYHEDSLHRKLNGKLKRPAFLTNILLSIGRKKDLSTVRKFASNPSFLVSANSTYSAQRSRDVYGIKCGVLHPCVDQNEFSLNFGETTNPIKQRTEAEYVVTVGTANWAKASMETISMLSGTGVALAHVGGGTDAEKAQLEQHAKHQSVDLWIAPRLSSEELAKLMADALAVVSMAHKEPFGLTPIEAFSIGTPALFVDEGGFRDTIVDGKCGRLIPRDNLSAWHAALEEARHPDNRKNWSAYGRKRISELQLSPEEQAEKIHRILLG